MADEKQTMTDKFFHKDSPGELIIAYDRDGTFVNPRSYLSLSPVESEETSESDFRSFLVQHVNETHVYAYIPDLLIEQYRFPSMKEVPSPETMPHEQYIREKLLPYVRENGIESERYVGLRDAMYARSRDLKIAFVMNQQHPQVDDPFDYVDFINEQKVLRQAYNNCPITELPIHAVQTSRGMLFFSNSELGLQGLKQFYQELVDGYFSVHSERGPVCEYSVSYNSWDLNALTDRCYRKGEDGLYRFHFEDVLYDRKQIPAPETWKLTMEASMKSTSSDFLYLAEKTGCRINQFNNNVWRLLYLCEHGFSRDIIMNKQFEHNHEFYELTKKVDNCFNAPDPNGKDDLFHLIDELHRKADEILRTRYDIRDHRSLANLLSDPAYDPKVGSIRLTYPMRQVLSGGYNLYLPVIDRLHPNIHFLTADFTNGYLRLSERPFPGKTFQEKKGKIVPYKVPSEKNRQSNPAQEKKKRSHKL